MRTKELSALSGLSLRQLQLWTEYGVLWPERPQRNREFTTQDAALVLVAADLRARGWSLRDLKAILDALSGVDLMTARYLVIRGQSGIRVTVTDSTDFVIERMYEHKSRNLCSVIDLTKCLSELSELSHAA